jgi:hypothetical protein
MNWFERRIEDLIVSIRDDPVRNATKISVGDDLDNPTYWRWFVWPRNQFLNLYLHNWLNDDAHDPHDHRMMNISFILQGSYFEERFVVSPTPGQPLPRMETVFRKRYSVTMRLPATPHRVVLPRDAEGRPIPSWSLFLGFPQWRNWGFWCSGKDGLTASWRPHEEYAMSADPTGKDYGRKGRGCDE